MRKICIINQKGGVGKTTTTVNLAIGLARKKRKVLILDLDAQGNVSTCLGKRGEKTMYDLLVNKVPISECIVNIEKNVDAVTSDGKLAEAETILMGRPNRERILSRALEDLDEEEYEFILMDCPPSMSLMSQNALLFADEALIPSSTEALSFVGLKQMLEVIDESNTLFDHDLVVAGILPTMYDRRNKICVQVLGQMENEYNGMTLEPIRVNSKLIEAPGHSKTIFDYARSSRGAEDYRKLVDFVLKND
ncbi:ParA family protein [Candidatus Woesearchaeota archaeon]|nr:ParA family protein [Candidatus Woesearchaeota archaeon]MBW3013766.1 ParA family protein [Candidatus Woesearchaeota archaeon]